jgi:nucleoside diphosphate kinase
MKFTRASRQLAEKHYAEHVGKSFFEKLLNGITSGPVVAMVWEGKGVIALTRTMMGATNPANSAPGTVRGDFAIDIGRYYLLNSPISDLRSPFPLFFLVSIDSINTFIEFYMRTFLLFNFSDTRTTHTHTHTHNLGVGM